MLWNFQIPSLGDVLNLMAAASEELFSPSLLGCEWNRNARASTDVLERRFNVCPGATGHVRAWNGNPTGDRVAGEKESAGGGVSVSRYRCTFFDFPFYKTDANWWKLWRNLIATSLGF